ncbi:hypothetical protein BH09ACT3_BH09ACT3_12560 [soil metagenome]
MRWRARCGLLPWPAKVGVVWLLSRVVTTALILVFASWQQQNPWTAARPDYFAFAQLWDSTWYHIVAVAGYPSELPMTDDGHVGESAWAFLPGYPMLVRLLMIVTGLPWAPISVLVSFAFSLGTALVFYRLMRERLPSSTALFSVVLFCVAPLSPILQLSYAEPMYLFLLTLALLLLVQRRYALLLPVVAVMALTRPSGLAFALALGLHVVHRWWVRRREPFPPAQAILAIGVTAFSVVMGFAWLMIAWAVTGSPSAYTDTELAWRMPYIGYVELVPFAAWVQGAGFWGAEWGIGALAYVLLALLVVGFFAALFLPAVRRLGVDLRLWLASYGLYLLAVFFPQSSTFRLLMPMSPLLGAMAQPTSRSYRVLIVLLFVAGQYGWLSLCWWSNGYDWTPP